MRLLSFLLLTLFVATNVSAQKQGLVQGTVRDKATQEILIGVNIIALNTQPLLGAQTDLDGNYTLSLPVGSYNLQASYIGYKTEAKYNIEITSGNITMLNFEIDQATTGLLDTVKITANRSIRVSTVESPNSLQRLGVQEIKTAPGGNFDVFRVVQSLPGIGTTPNSSNRNDIIVRGGAPSENIYFIDGIEIPTINHFATQGAGGGSNGILNVSFIEELTLNSSAFDAQYDNSLSSIFQFKQRNGNNKRLQGNIRLGSSELAATLDGPISKKTTFLASARRSYLQYLFKAIDLAIRPNYWDFQYKVTHQFNPKTSLTFIGLGAIDNFYSELTANTSANNAYIIKQTPVIDQWNYAIGTAFKHIHKKGILNIALSRNMQNNLFRRYEDGLRNDPTKQLLRSQSQEIENKLRITNKQFFGGTTLTYGVSAQYVKYNNDFDLILTKEIRDTTGNVQVPLLQSKFTTDIKFFRYGGFAQISHTFFNDKLGVSAGIRTDMNSFTKRGNNALDALSPRAAITYQINEKWKINASVGLYAKLPSYTILGYRNQDNQLSNQDARYITNTHYVTGFEYIPRESTRITAEAFYKTYKYYPVTTREGISLGNLGSDFGFIGNEDINSTGLGLAQGIEIFVQQKLIKNFFGFVSYTYVVSKLSGNDARLIPSAWDNRHLLSATLGKKFKRGWELGARYRLAGGVPYTPLDTAASRINYVTNGVGVLDFNRINSARLPLFQQLDFRVDKKFYFKRLTFDLFFDLTNALFQKNVGYPSYVFKRKDDNSGFETTDGAPVLPDGSNAIPVVLDQGDVVFIPTIGFAIEF